MGKGAKGSKSYATPLAPWVEASHRKLIKEAEREAYSKDYVPYAGERVAGFTDEEQAGFGARRALFEGGDPDADWARAELERGAGLTSELGDLSVDYGAQDFDFGTFGQAEAQQYMSPYQDAVTEIARRKAREEFELADIEAKSRRVASGAMGGYRDSLMEFLGESERAEVMGDITATGQQSAFENAQQQYERDRRASIRAAEMGDASAQEASRVKYGADLANQQRVFDQSRLAGEFAQQRMDLGTTAQARELQRITAMEQAGATQREMEQTIMNMQVEDFENQTNYNRNRISWLQSIIAGTPVDIGGTEYAQASPTLASQALSLGLGAKGISDLIGG